MAVVRVVAPSLSITFFSSWWIQLARNDSRWRNRLNKRHTDTKPIAPKKKRWKFGGKKCQANRCIECMNEWQWFEINNGNIYEYPCECSNMWRSRWEWCRTGRVRVRNVRIANWMVNKCKDRPYCWFNVQCLNRLVHRLITAAADFRLSIFCWSVRRNCFLSFLLSDCHLRANTDQRWLFHLFIYLSLVSFSYRTCVINTITSTWIRV